MPATVTSCFAASRSSASITLLTVRSSTRWPGLAMIAHVLNCRSSVHSAQRSPCSRSYSTPTTTLARPRYSLGIQSSMGLSDLVSRSVYSPPSPSSTRYRIRSARRIGSCRSVKTSTISGRERPNTSRT